MADDHVADDRHLSAISDNGVFQCLFAAYGGGFYLQHDAFVHRSIIIIHLKVV